jgi:Copper amine oxidase, enzyme domain
MRGRTVAILTLAAAAAVLAAPAGAQPVCNLAGEHLMSWPVASPVWQFCWLRPIDSSGSRGSGLEIRNVYYNGHLVLKSGHVPMLNVQYVQTSCGCDCYRDWMYQQDYFLADNIITPHVYAEPDVPAQTVCDVGGGVDVCTAGQPNCFDGVAAEKFADPLVLTTQFEAGWYRYTMRWKFYMDGRIQPVFGFSAVNAGCVSCTHKHHAYWRLDFDIDGAANDIVTEGPDPNGLGAGGRGRERPPIVVLPSETMRLNDVPNLTWSVIDSGTHRGYRIVPGAETALPADAFSQGDFWALAYHANEIDDGGHLGDCPVDFSTWLNGESLTGDVVAWYRSGWLHQGGDLADCDPVGPTLYPIGDWSP